MKKQIIAYILSAACILYACSADNDNEPDPVTTPGEREMLSLTVTASDIVVSDGLSSRSIEEGGITTFKPNDLVGLIVLDNAANLLVDNVPYKLEEDGTSWNFAGDVDKQPYYDAAMSTYIVYYPYKKEINGCKTVADIKSNDVFKPQKNQSFENTYRQADILAWTSEGEAIRRIEAKMEHVYDSFTFHINIKWDLAPINEELVYQPIQETLKDFKIEITTDKGEKIILFDNDASQNLIYRAEDGTYRYLLTSGQGGKITWHYTYRDITFRGERTIPAEGSGKRFIHHEKADMGKLPGSNMQISDFYCSNEQNKGYVFPWDAADQINEKKEKCFVGRHCIGIVVGVGQHENDFSDYSESGIYADSEIKGKICHGYVMALTDADGKLEWAIKSTPGASKFVGTYFHATKDIAIYDWNGFYSHQKIKNYKDASLDKFPAANACENYGVTRGLSAPANTTGWFLPSLGMINFVWKTTGDIETALKKYKMSKLLDERFTTIKNYIKTDPVYTNGHYSYTDDIRGFDSDCAYWSSNECTGNGNYQLAFSAGPIENYTVQKSNSTSGIAGSSLNTTVRAFLAF